MVDWDTFTAPIPTSEINGTRLIGQSIGFVKAQVLMSAMNDWEVEKYTFFDTHFNERLWLVLNVEYGVVTDIEMGVPFEER